MVAEKEAASAPPETYAAAMNVSWPLLPVSSSVAALSPSKSQDFGNACLKSENPLPKILAGLSKEACASEDAAGGALQMWSAGTSIGECWSLGFPPSPQPTVFRKKKGRRPSHERHQRAWVRCHSGTRILSAGFL